MEVGKKYIHANNPSETYECIALTPRGNAVLKNPTGWEFMCYGTSWAHYKEYKEPRGLTIYVKELSEKLYVTTIRGDHRDTIDTIEWTEKC